MNEGLLELFETIKKDFLLFPLNEFAPKARNENYKFEFYSAVSGTPLASDYHLVQDYKNTASNESFPQTLRQEAYDKLKYKIDEIIAKIKSGSISISKKRLAQEIVNQIEDAKVKKICLEINSTSDENTLSLTQSVGECLKWTLWYRAKRSGTKLKEGGELMPLIDEAISKPYYTDNAVNRFLKEYRDNFLKTGYDMVRHSEGYIPDIVLINPAVDALEHILKTTCVKAA